MIIENNITYNTNDFNKFTHNYKFYENDILFYQSNLYNKDYATIDGNKLIVNDHYCLRIKDKDNIKVELYLKIINNITNGSNISVNMIENNNINISFRIESNISDKFEQINEKIENKHNLIGDNFQNLLPLKSKFTIDNIFKFNIDNIDINFLSDIKKIIVFEKDIIYNFKPNSFLEFDMSIFYEFANLKSHIFILKEKLILFDQNNTILDEANFNLKDRGISFRRQLNFDSKYYTKLVTNITNLKIKLYLERINYDNDIVFKLKTINDYQNNFIVLKYYRYTI